MGKKERIKNGPLLVAPERDEAKNKNVSVWYLAKRFAVFASIAQRLERTAVNRQVTGSIPVGGVLLTMAGKREK